jgi:hypothetical protein
VFTGLGQLVTRHPWRVIGAWVIIAVAVIATATALPTTSNEASFLPSSYESIKAQNLPSCRSFPRILSDGNHGLFGIRRPRPARASSSTRTTRASSRSRPQNGTAPDPSSGPAASTA